MKVKIWNVNYMMNCDVHTNSIDQITIRNRTCLSQLKKMNKRESLKRIDYLQLQSNIGLMVSISGHPQVILKGAQREQFDSNNLYHTDVNDNLTETRKRKTGSQDATLECRQIIALLSINSTGDFE